MPHQKHSKNNRHNANRADPNNNVHADNNGNAAPARRGREEQRMQQCCLPTTCPVKDELIDTENVGDAVRVVCNNDACTVGSWMHKSCFDTFEESVLNYLRSCGRARSWSEKQRLQNLWTKKGYDLAFKACDCMCGKGHLRKDLDYVRPVQVDNASKKKGKKKSTCSKPDLNTGNVVARERRMSGNNNSNANTGAALVCNGSTKTNGTHNGSAVTNGKLDNALQADPNGNLSLLQHIRKASPSITIINNQNDNRLRANSISSTGSSPPHSASSINSGSDSPVPQSPQNNPVVRQSTKNKFSYPEHLCYSDGSPINGTMFSMFPKRNDLSAFSILPRHKQNGYHIKMEDDSTNGIDDVHTFVLNHLSTYKISSLHCVLCKNEMSVFDRYPLVDGTLFLSPQAYDTQVLQVISDGRIQYINAVCVTCLEGGNEIRCASCKRRWDGSSLQLGSMYSYDIFAAMPCCQKRLTCKHCRRAVIDASSGLPYFSAYSHMITCPYCKAYDYHFIRPLTETFLVKVSIWN